MLSLLLRNENSTKCFRIFKAMVSNVGFHFCNVAFHFFQCSRTPPQLVQGQNYAIIVFAKTVFIFYSLTYIWLCLHNLNVNKMIITATYVAFSYFNQENSGNIGSDSFIVLQNEVSTSKRSVRMF